MQSIVTPFPKAFMRYCQHLIRGVFLFLPLLGNSVFFVYFHLQIYSFHFQPLLSQTASLPQLFIIAIKSYFQAVLRYVGRLQFYFSWTHEYHSLFGNMIAHIKRYGCIVFTYLYNMLLWLIESSAAICLPIWRKTHIILYTIIFIPYVIQWKQPPSTFLLE